MIYYAALVDGRSRIRRWVADLICARNADRADLELLASGLEALDRLIARENGVRPMTGFVATLSEEQRAEALAYAGDDHLGRAHYAHPNDAKR